MFNCFQVFREAIKAAVAYKQNSTDFLDQVMRELEVRNLAQQLTVPSQPLHVAPKIIEHGRVAPIGITHLRECGFCRK